MRSQIQSHSVTCHSNPVTLTDFSIIHQFLVSLVCQNEATIYLDNSEPRNGFQRSVVPSSRVRVRALTRNHYFKERFEVDSRCEKCLVFH